MASEQRAVNDIASVRTGLLPTGNEKGSPKAQTQGQRLKYLLLGNLLYDVWHSDFIAIVFSLACLIAIAVVSRVYDGEHVPALPKGITLNAINSVMATASKSALLYSVASNISQWKWIWYAEENFRRLGDLQIFDDASRGPLGALQLCTSRTKSSLGLIGALLVLLATAFDPFIQQLLTYPADTVYRPSNLTWTRQARMFPGTGPIYYESSLVPSLAFENALWSNESAQFERQPVTFLNKKHNIEISAAPRTSIDDGRITPLATFQPP